MARWQHLASATPGQSVPSDEEDVRVSHRPSTQDHLTPAQYHRSREPKSVNNLRAHRRSTSSSSSSKYIARRRHSSSSQNLSPLRERRRSVSPLQGRTPVHKVHRFSPTRRGSAAHEESERRERSSSTVLEHSLSRVDQTSSTDNHEESHALSLGRSNSTSEQERLNLRERRSPSPVRRFPAERKRQPQRKLRSPSVIRSRSSFSSEEARSPVERPRSPSPSRRRSRSPVDLESSSMRRRRHLSPSRRDFSCAIEQPKTSMRSYSRSDIKERMSEENVICSADEGSFSERGRDGLSEPSASGRSASPSWRRLGSWEDARTSKEVQTAREVPKRRLEPAQYTMEAAVGRAGGVYIPPFKLARLQCDLEVAPNSEADQRRHWEALRKSINGFVNKASRTNLALLVEEIFCENLIRGRGLMARAIIRAQLTSPGFTSVFAALLAVLNSKLPGIGELVLTRLVLQFQRAYKRNDKLACIACIKFMAHLVNQRVLTVITVLELCTLLLDVPTNDSVEVCCTLIQECGERLEELQPRGLTFVFERLRNILAEGDVSLRAQYVVEKTFEFRRANFAAFPAVLPELDLIDEEDQTTHSVDLLGEGLDKQDMLDVFQPVPPEQYATENKKWQEISRDILGLDENGDGEGDSQVHQGDDDASSVDSEAEADEAALRMVVIKDMTEQELINLRKTIYLTIKSSASYEECSHKLLSLNLPTGKEMEVCSMLVDYSAMETTFSHFIALVAERLCLSRGLAYSRCFADCFDLQYKQVHRLKMNMLRNTAKFFAHLFAAKAVPWSCFCVIQLTEEATTAAGRIFLQILLQDMTSEMGMNNIESELQDPELQPYLGGIFPREPASHVRFSCNFFRAIGLGPLADRLKAFL